MNRVGKRILFGVLIVAVLIAAAGAAAYWDAFGGRRPIHDGTGPEPGVTTVAMGFVSAFLLDAGNGQFALIDTGTSSSASRIVDALRSRGSGPDAVQAIFLTHEHKDHIGGLGLFPHASVYALATERDGVIHDGGRVTRGLADGESVQVGTVTVRAFAVPGHTPGSAAYLADDTLFLGDAASATSAGVVRGPVWMFSKSTSQGIDSLHALAHRLEDSHTSVRALAFAHSGPILENCIAGLAQVH